MHKINIKRIYEVPEASDGYRMLVDRLWPRGMKKEDAHIDQWNQAIAPTNELRKWYAHKPERFKAFAEKYRRELSSNMEEVIRIKKIAQKQDVTLLYASKEPVINHAVVLKEFLESV